MKIHQVTYIKDGEPRKQFTTSDGDASKLMTALKADKTITEKPTRGPVDVPTDKAGLIEWLNKNATYSAPL